MGLPSGQNQKKDTIAENVMKFRLDTEIPGIPSLKRLPLFAALPERSRAFQAFSKQIETVFYKKSEIIYTPGERRSHFYLVHIGEVHILQSIDSENRIITIAGSGDVFGESSFLSGETYSTTAVAALDSVLFKIDGEAFITLLSKEPSVGQAFTLLLSGRLRKSINLPTKIPSKIYSIVYPEKPQTGTDITSSLADQLSLRKQEKTLLINFSKECDPSCYDMNRLIERMNEDDIDQIHRNSKKNPILHCNIDELSEESLPRAIPGFLGLLKKYFSMILVDCSHHPMAPAILRIVTQSDNVILVKTYPGTIRQNLWKQTAKRYNSLIKNFSDILITISHEPVPTVKPRVSLHQANKDREFLKCAPAILHQNHFRIKVVRGDGEGEPVMFRVGIGRVARKLGALSRGLCLGGGGARSLAHIGILEVLEREDIHFDSISGASMGAIVAAGHAMGLKSDDLVLFIKEYIPDSTAIFDKNLPFISFFKGKKIGDIIRRVFWDVHFEDLEIPFFCNGSDLNTGRLIVFEKGRLTTALRASVSLPGIFPPVRMRHYALVDGGVLNNLPGDLLRERGFDRIVGISVTPRVDRFSARTVVDPEEKGLVRGWIDYVRVPPILKIMTRSISLQGRALLTHQTNAFDHVIHPDISGYQMFDLHLHDEIIQKGRKALERELGFVKAILNQKDLTGIKKIVADRPL